MQMRTSTQGSTFALFRPAHAYSGRVEPAALRLHGPAAARQHPQLDVPGLPTSFACIAIALLPRSFCLRSSLSCGFSARWTTLEPSPAWARKWSSSLWTPRCRKCSFRCARASVRLRVCVSASLRPEVGTCTCGHTWALRVGRGGRAERRAQMHSRGANRGVDAVHPQHFLPAARTRRRERQ
jgi:hypothetical protein